MSVKVQVWVYEHSESRLADRLVLLAIADEADDDGTSAFPSQRRIAHKARVGQTTARRAIDHLEEAGELYVIRPEKTGRGFFNRYIVLMGRSIAEALGETEGVQIGALSNPKNAPERAGTRRNAPPIAGANPMTLIPSNPECARSPKPSTKTRLPEDWEPSEQTKEWCRREFPQYATKSTLAHFRDHHLAEGNRKLDWDRAFQTWVRRQPQFERATSGPARTYL